MIALLKTLWRLTYQDVHDWLTNWSALALACGLPLGEDGQPRIPCPSQLCKRWQAAGAPLFESLFVLTVCRAVRCRLIGARDLIIDSAPLLAWRRLSRAYAALSWFRLARAFPGLASQYP